MSDSTFDLSFDSELDEFDPLEDTGADDDENEGGDYTAISSATDAPAQQLEAESDNRTPAERIDDLFKSMAPRRKVLLGILSFVQELQTAEAVNAHVDKLQQDNFSVYTAANLCNLRLPPMLPFLLQIYIRFWSGSDFGILPMNF